MINARRITEHNSLSMPPIQKGRALRCCVCEGITDDFTRIGGKNRGGN